MPRGIARKPVIAITLGDPAGIGPEVVLKALAQPAIQKLADFRVIGSAEILRFYARLLGLPMPACEIDETIPWPQQKKMRPGRWSQTTGCVSLSWVERAIDLCLSGETHAMVTAPICKAAWQAAGSAFTGHTELLERRTNTSRAVMMFVAGRLRLALATIHRPLAEVPRLLTPQGIASVAIIVAAALRRHFGLRRARLAILGLNPHAGEEGCLGDEEKKIIKPAIALLRRKGINAIGPLPADTAFYRAFAGAWDAVLAMYHDQGLAPLKAVAFDTAVNVTLGLPIIRTSPDHGTAFDIAGKNLAQPSSLVEAIKLAAAMAQSRAWRGRRKKAQNTAVGRQAAAVRLELRLATCPRAAGL